MSDLEKIPIEMTELSIRAISALKRNNVIYLNDLVQLTSRQMLEWEHFGIKTLNEIREFLCKQHLSLKDETVNPDIKFMILNDLPHILKEVRLRVNEAMRELKYFSFKIDQVAKECEKITKKTL